MRVLIVGGGMIVGQPFDDRGRLFCGIDASRRLDEGGAVSGQLCFAARKQRVDGFVDHFLELELGAEMLGADGIAAVRPRSEIGLQPADECACRGHGVGVGAIERSAKLGIRPRRLSRPLGHGLLQKADRPF